MPGLLVTALPAVLLALTVMWGLRIQKASKFQIPPQPKWPDAENPGLALELAATQDDVDAVLGPPASDEGRKNREVAVRLQKLDFVFIPLYTLFFIAASLVIGEGAWSLAAVASALLTAGFDVMEDVSILAMVGGRAGSSARRFGQLKWFFYFATLALEGILLFRANAFASGRSGAAVLAGIFLMAIALGGGISSLKGSFTGISSGSKVSFLGLVALAAAPLVVRAQFSWWTVAEYAFLMRVPLVAALVLVTLPLLAFLTPARSLLRGLFDLRPLSLFVVTLATLALAGTICMTGSLALFHGHARFGAPALGFQSLSTGWWLVIMAGMGLPVIGSAAVFSIRQEHGIARNVVAVLGGAAVALGVAAYLIPNGADLIGRIAPGFAGASFEHRLAATRLFAGYVDPAAGLDDPWRQHLGAIATFLVVVVLWVGTGIYGWTRLGKQRTVPALSSALMLMIMLTWILSATAFFFDAWRVPVLLIVVAAGTLTAQSARSDHSYALRARSSNDDAPDPAATVLAANSPHVIVVAANGGGIQAGAWAAQVLYGLHEYCGEGFDDSVRLISSVSGGSVGAACFLHWLADRKQARRPDEAAAESSLDEVAWGLGFTDFIRALLPWVFGWLIGRGRALEKAWRLNSSRDLSSLGAMDEPLSNWNAKVAAGTLPAVVMNATIVETGERLLLATTRMGGGGVTGRARVDATELHTINGVRHDVGVVTAARLSASFPYVTPAARSDAPGPQPHVVDGGYYDNYGMATLVEWLDEALSGAGGRIKRVLVLQIHGAPVNPEPRNERHAVSRGWFYQAIAPLAALAAVRSAGQAAHNDIELELLQQKWGAAGVSVESVPFEFRGTKSPMSWHLTPQEVAEIRRAWREDMDESRQAVCRFLAKSVGA